ncbi:GTP 3',8-cyclase MoaA [Pelagibacterales bacterium SAG-MED31]|nr:GTP 3',8-cyclase MoaA [Pelagibacterales bacterium SAG-MED31]
MQIVDQFLRKINYLRVSVTDRCDLRCVYCMKEKMNFLPKNEILSLEEIERLCDNFIELGVEKIRLTGGEPLVRKDVINLIKNLNYKKSNTKLKEITLTTNGSLLKKFARELKNNGINRINVSLDTIIEEKYKEITRFGNLNNVLDGIEEAKKNDIKVKINTVVFKNFNEEHISDLVSWANKNLLDITFIEVMPMSDTDIPRHMQFVSLDSTYKKLDMIYHFEKTNYRTGGPSNYYTSRNLDIKIGFITPLSNNFCASCNRIRISSTGKLYMCLGQNDFVDFREILRTDRGDNYIKEKIRFALSIKPRRHDFIINSGIKPYLNRHMNETGG